MRFRWLRLGLVYIIRYFGYFGIIRYYSALDQVNKYGWFLLLLVGISCFLFFRIPCLFFLSVWLVLVVVGCGSGWLVG